MAYLMFDNYQTVTSFILIDKSVKTSLNCNDVEGSVTLNKIVLYK